MQEILQDIVFVILYGGVIMLNVVAALYLLLRRGNAIAPEVSSPVRLRRWTAAFMMASALSHVFWMYYAIHPSPATYTLVCGLDMLMLAPSIAGSLLSMLQDRHRSVWPVLVALVPVVVLLAMCVIPGDEVLYLPLVIYVIVLYASIMLYMFFAVRRYGRWLRDNYADLENKEVWQSFIILAGFLLFLAMYSSTSVGNLVLVYLLQIDCIIIVALLLWRVETLQQLSESTAPEAEEQPEQEPKAASTVSESSATTTPTKMDALLKKHCEDKLLYLQNDLTLTQLANAIGTNRTYLSYHFSQLGITYNAYINGLRISHFMRLYEKAKAEGLDITAQRLASESGYRSYGTFSAAFKQYTGQTVTAWIRDGEQ